MTQIVLAKIKTRAQHAFGADLHSALLFFSCVMIPSSISDSPSLAVALPQVEHPVTEGITGVNIPALQLQIGMGIPLWRVPSLRATFGKDPKGLDQFDPNVAAQKQPEGHVVAVRITSENAQAGFKPTAGRIDELNFRPTPEVWGYFSVKSGGGIHEFSDSQVGARVAEQNIIRLFQFSTSAILGKVVFKVMFNYRLLLPPRLQPASTRA